MTTVPGLGPDGYLLGNNQDSAGRCLQWFRDNVAPGRRQRGPRLRRDHRGGIDGSGRCRRGDLHAVADRERSPVDDRAARAGFHNISVATTQADLARAVLEGVAYNLRWLLEGAEHFTGRRLDPLRIIGGGAQSDLWCQIVADVCDRTVERVADPLLCGLRGVAIAAGIALGAVTRDEVRALVPTDRTFRPDPGSRATYDRLYAEFPRLHKVQRPMFARLNR